jgi:sugar phosphate isomerase/epimerase
MAYQLYSVREYMDKDPINTLSVLKDAGYEAVEVHGYDPSSQTLYGLKPKELRKRMDEIGLSAPSGHYNFQDVLDGSKEELLSFADQSVEVAQVLGSEYIVWPWLYPAQRNIDNYKHLADAMNRIGERAKKANIKLAYHNHGFEFQDKNGETGYDILLRDTDPELVNFQLDMYWVKHSSSKSSKDLIAENPGRIKMWHVKDMEKETSDFTELGNGIIDYTKTLPDPSESGLDYFFIEQDDNFAINALESAQTSARYYKADLKVKF